MALKKLVVGNWKMNGLSAQLTELGRIAEVAAKHGDVDVAICPPVTLIGLSAAKYPNFTIGAQDCHFADNGAHTGCLSAAMLKESGASLVIVGHSERRADQHETDAEVKAKAEAAHRLNIKAIICVGETEAERDSGKAIEVVTNQLAASLADGADGTWLTIAYEPVWAIGTGRVPSVADVSEMHAALRKTLLATMGEGGSAVNILYGGSVNGSNARELLSTPNVDGALVGGASLTVEKFAPIIEAAAEI